jgi:rod shape determining protein RodA
MMLNESRRSRAHFDFWLTAMVYVLSAFGVVCVAVATFSTSSSTENTLLNYIVSSYYGLRQAIFFLISPIVVGVITFFPYEFIRRRSQLLLFYYFACGLLLVALGGQATGVKAWIDILWGYTLQPSEFVKLACIIVTAKYLEKNRDPMGSWNSALRLAALMGIPWILTLAQHETGSVLVMVFVFGVMLYFGGIRMRVMGGLIAAAVVGLAVLYAVTVASGTTDYRITRILSFLNPDLVDEAATYQVNNSKGHRSGGSMGYQSRFIQGIFCQPDYVPENGRLYFFNHRRRVGLWAPFFVVGK